MTAINTAELAIYAAFSPLTIWLAYKHGKPGLLGWGYVLVFCSLRIIGGALSLSGSKSAVIVSSIGLSPLLLSTAGIYHEAVHYFHHKTNPWPERIQLVIFHIIVATGLALLAVGLSGLQSNAPSPDDEKDVKIGLGIMTASWALLVIRAIISLGQVCRQGKRSLPSSAFVLLLAVVISLIFSGIRMIYTLIALTSSDAKLNPFSGKLVFRVVLCFLPELIMVLIFLAAGVFTRNIRAAACTSRKGYHASTPNV